MPTDYRALHNQYAQGMQQPGTVARQGSQPNAAPGAFNFLQGWTASPHAGYLPPNQNSYGTPITGNQIGPYAPQPGAGGSNGQMPGGGMPGGTYTPPGGAQGQYPGGNYGVPRLPQGPERGQNYLNTVQQWVAQQNALYQQSIAPQGSQSYDQNSLLGKPMIADQVNPGQNVNNPWGG